MKVNFLVTSLVNPIKYSTKSFLLYIFVVISSMFQVNSAYAAYEIPTPIYPMGGSYYYGTKFTFKWHAVSGAIGYKFFIYDRSIPGISFRNDNLSTSVCDSSGTCRYTPNVSPLPIHNTHVWRVKALFSGGGESPDYSYKAFNIIEPPVAINSVGYSPNPVEIGNKQTFTLRYTNAVKCYTINQYGNEVVYYQGALRTGTYNWTSPTRTEAKKYNFTVYCEGMNGTRVQKSTGYEVLAPNVKPSVTNITLSNNEKFVTGQSLTVSASGHDSDGSISALEFKLDNGSWQVDTSYPYQANLGSLAKGNHTVYYRAKDNDGEYSNLTSRNINVYDNVTLTNLGYTPNPVALGNNQVFSFNYANATKCYAYNEFGNEITYVTQTSTPSSGTYTWTSPIRDEVKNYDFEVTCLGVQGNSVTKPVGYEVVAPVVINASYQPYSVELGNEHTFKLTASGVNSCRNGTVTYPLKKDSNGNEIPGVIDYSWTTTRDTIGEGSSTVVCDTPFGEQGALATYEITAPVPEINVSYEPYSVELGGEHTFRLTASNIISCRNGSDTVTYPFKKDSNGNDIEGVIDYSWPVTRDTIGNGSSTVICETFVGEQSRLATYEITAPIPEINVRYEPYSVELGDEHTFRLTASNVESCRNGSDTVTYPFKKDSEGNDIEGVIDYSWSITRDTIGNGSSTVICKTLEGEQSRLATYEITKPVPRINARYEPFSVEYGNEHTFRLTASNVESCRNSSGTVYPFKEDSDGNPIEGEIDYSWTTVRDFIGNGSSTVYCETSEGEKPDRADYEITAPTPELTVVYDPNVIVKNTLHTMKLDAKGIEECRNSGDFVYSSNREGVEQKPGVIAFDWPVTRTNVGLGSSTVHCDTLTGEQLSEVAHYYVIESADEIIIDNNDALYAKTTGDWQVFAASGAYGTDSVVNSDGGLFEWQVVLPEEETYEVFVWWTYDVNRSSNVPITIDLGGNNYQVNVNQQDQSLAGKWISLGSYRFPYGIDNYIRVTGVAGGSSADAIKLIRSNLPYTQGLIPNGDFELGNDFAAIGSAVMTLESGMPLSGTQSLKVNLGTTDSISYQYTNFVDISDKLLAVSLTGYIKTNQDQIAVDVVVDYLDDDQPSNATGNQLINTVDSIVPFTIDVETDKNRQVEQINVTISNQCSTCQPAELLLDNIQLQVTEAPAISFTIDLLGTPVEPTQEEVQ